ncbi:MAG: hypothetical protein V3V31_03065 [Methylococcales bacterium]
MEKITLLDSALVLTLLSGTAMAADFQALTGVQATPTPIENAELSAIEGGAVCDAHYAGSAGGVVLCAWLVSGASGGTASFTVANELPVTGAQFLQVVN